ncbi:MAG: hypothetical protein Q9195_005137 [Heterodermia aff. obscurata]
MDSANFPSPFMPAFECFQNELDEHHDRRERIIKASRDITALSKKIIFSLQRVRALQAPLPTAVAKEIELRTKTITELFVAVAPDLQGTNAWRYQRQISGGIQEFIEAISFRHYLRTQRLITIDEAQAEIPGGVALTADDFLLGLFDLIGELMRFAVTSMAITGALPRGSPLEVEDGQGRDVLTDLRYLRTHFEALDISSGTPGSFNGLKKDVEKKMEVMKTCVEKVEKAVYEMIVRGRERPKGWMPEATEDRAEVPREAVESY